MLITFGNLTLGDDQATNGTQIRTTIADFGADSAFMNVQAYGAANPFKAAMGNVDGKFSFVASQTFATLDAMLLFLKGLFSLVNTNGTLKIIQGTTTITCANATLKRFERDKSSRGVRPKILYQFELTTVA